MFKIGDKVKVIDVGCGCPECKRYIGKIGVVTKNNPRHTVIKLENGRNYESLSRYFKRHSIRSKRKRFKDWCRDV